MQRFAKALQHAERLLADHPDDNDVIRALYAAACAGVGRSQDAIGQYQRLMQAQPNNVAYPDRVGACPQVRWRHRRGRAPVPTGIPPEARSRRRLLELGEYQILRVHRRRNSSHERGRGRLDHGRERPHPALFRARHRIREPRRVSARLRALRQRQRLEAGHRLPQLRASADTHRQPDRGLHRAVVRAPIRTRQRSGGSHLHRWPAQSRFDAARANTRLPLARWTAPWNCTTSSTSPSVCAAGQTMPARHVIHASSPNSTTTTFRRFGEQFIEDTRAYRGDAPFFIDKMPNNFFHIGLIG